MISQKKVVGTVQARMSSSRLPGKVLMPLAGEPALKRLVDRMRKSKYLDEVIVATTVNEADDKIVDFCTSNNIKVHRGSENDVLKRILNAGKNAKADIMVAITGDCPLIDFRHINQVVEKLIEDSCDYVSNAIERSFPDGFDAQAFYVKILDEVDKLTNDPIDRIHGTYYIYTHPNRFKIKNIKAEGKMHWPDLGVTLDEMKDYNLINIIFERLLSIDEYFSAEDVVDLLLKNPELLNINKDVKRKKPSEG